VLPQLGHRGDNLDLLEVSLKGSHLGQFGLILHNTFSRTHKYLRICDNIFSRSTVSC